MKYLLTISLFLIAFSAFGQLQVKQGKYLELIPTFSTSYLFTHIPVEGKMRSGILPNIHIGAALKNEHWFSSVQVGVLHPEIELKIGVVIKIKTWKK